MVERRRRVGGAWIGVLGLLISACGGSQEDAQQPQVVQGNNAYSQPPPGGYAGPSTQQPPGTYNPQAAPSASAPPASPLAMPCTNDIICGTHRCNLQAGRCAFPCATNQDCAAGFSCVGAGGPTAICAPGGGGQ
ncbi:hypothetical protein [Polyangium aurulentum]|uniref:hypothetical protein n=1 Tax=Polyangium aurulentum TaxID=2567896 RepID=UPI0010ADDFBA|nr:hypothetical protein [Polyangium aurulentum]UQA62676.1 hypothetical protein E8A73_020360 [Polyangium aurulentum]